MESVGHVLVTLGAVLVAGLAAEWTHGHVPLPRVSLLMLLGVLIGPVGVDLLPSEQEQWFPVVAALTLTMVGLLIGGEFSVERVRAVGPQLAIVALFQGLAAAAFVGAGLWALGFELPLALALSGIAVATAPAAIAAIIQEREASGPLPQLLLGVAAAADALALMAFSVLLVLAGIVSPGPAAGHALVEALRELGGGVILGVAIGVPGAYLSGRLREGRPLLEEALGMVLLCAGIGLWLDVSYLLGSVVAGSIIVNMAGHHRRTMREIEGIEWPLLVVFFVLAGAALEPDALIEAGTVGAAYVVLRSAGKVAGAVASTGLIRLAPTAGGWIGLALTPQAGVALGLALLAEERLPRVGSDVVAVVIASTVVFELIGPVLTGLALRRTSLDRSALDSG